MTEKELKKFFFTVANYPFFYLPHLSFNDLFMATSKYFNILTKIPMNSNYYNFAEWLAKGFLYRLNLNDYSFTEKEITTFAVKRQVLISALNKIISDLPLAENEELSSLVKRANKLQSQRFFELTNDAERVKIKESYPNHPPRTTNILNQTPFMESVFEFACLSLSLFLTDENVHRIKHCKRCKAFFFQARNDERNQFCSDDCRNLHNREQRKTDKGKAKRAEYMKEYRAILRKRKRTKEREKKLKRLMDGGYTRKQAENFLNDDK